MRAHPITPLLLGLLVGCGGSSGEENPRTLWLALDGAETRVRLIESEPRPY